MAEKFQWVKLALENWKTISTILVIIIGWFTDSVRLNQTVAEERQHKEAIIESSAYREQLLQPIIQKAETVVEKTVVVKGDNGEAAVKQHERRFHE